MFRAVTFDLWETLLTDTPSRAQPRNDARIAGMLGVLRQAGFAVEDESLRAAFERSWDIFEDVGMGQRDLTTPEQIEVILGLLDADGLARLNADAREALGRAYVEPVFDSPPLPLEGAEQALAALRGSGCKLGLISNTGRTPGWAMRVVLEREGLLGYFGALAFSDEERIRKPHPCMFERVLDVLGVAGEESVHVGDNVVTDVGGAQGVGMKGVLLARAWPVDAPFTPDAHVSSLSELVPTLRALALGSDRRRSWPSTSPDEGSSPIASDG